jgi:hypothetical protein
MRGNVMLNIRRIVAATLISLMLAAPVHAADPIKVGFSMALTGSVAQNGKQLIMALELWRDDVNANGGLLGRPVEPVYYDDQSNPTNVPGIYTKLITVDKVDLLLGPYATNMAAAAMPVIMQNNNQHACCRCKPAFPLFALLRHDPGRSGRDQSVLEGFLRARRSAKTEAADRCDRRCRCRIFENLG